MKEGRAIGGVLLVAGTTIGASMLALPVTTGVAGFVPALLLFGIVFVFMTYTALLFVEINDAIGGSANLITMVRRTLGPIGEWVAWFCYLLLLYSLTAAYISGSGALLIEVLEARFGIEVASFWGPLPFVIIFGMIVYLGTRPVDYLNRVLMAGLILCYVLLVAFVVPYVDAEMLARSQLSELPASLSIVITAFGFHIIVPTLSVYLNHDIKRMRLCVIVGGLIALLVYILWEGLILGVVPLEGEEGLIAMLGSGQPPASLTHSLKALTGRALLAPLAALFSFFAMVTSFLGVSLSLRDFLIDGLKIAPSIHGRIAATMLTFVPPLTFAWAYPGGFIAALSYAGFFVAILLGLLPVAMTYRLRYVLKMKERYRVVGGRVALGATFIFFLLVIALFMAEKSVFDWLLR